MARTRRGATVRGVETGMDELEATDPGRDGGPVVLDAEMWRYVCFVAWQLEDLGHEGDDVVLELFGLERTVMLDPTTLRMGTLDGRTSVVLEGVVVFDGFTLGVRAESFPTQEWPVWRFSYGDTVVGDAAELVAALEAAGAAEIADLGLLRRVVVDGRRAEVAGALGRYERFVQWQLEDLEHDGAEVALELFGVEGTVRLDPTTLHMGTLGGREAVVLEGSACFDGVTLGVRAEAPVGRAYPSWTFVDGDEPVGDADALAAARRRAGT